MTVWTVVAPGPSLKQLTTDHLREMGPVVVINNAAEAPIPRDFWSVLDHPRNFKHIWEPLPPEERDSLGIMWCEDNKTIPWHALGMRTWSHPTDRKAFNKQFLPQASKELVASNWTILATITRCVGYGAKRVKVFGADMKGRGYAYGPDISNRKDSVWDRRWIGEAEAFQKACVEWERAGTIVERCFPKE